jgi:hypothetical protein
MSSQLQVSGEAKIRDIQGPVVANSGVITALDGAASQYVRGDGTLADFPTSSGGGSSVSYYLNSSVSQGTIGGVAYRELSKEPIIGAGTDIAISTTGYVASYITDANDPDVILIPGGNFNCEFYFSVNNNTGNPFTYAELYKYDGTTFTLLGSSVGVPEYINQGTVINPYYFAIPVATATLALTDRLAIRIYVNVDGRTVTLHTENGHLCQVVTTLSKGMVSLNNLTDQSQFLTTGTSGTNFAIVSSGDTHTFNLPIASAANTGKLSSSDWSVFNAKEPAIAAGTTLQYFRGDKTFQTLDTTAVIETTNLYFTDARARLAISLTTTNTSGAATYNNTTGVLNIPDYSANTTNFVTIGTTQTITGTKTFNEAIRNESGLLLKNGVLSGLVGYTSLAGITNGLNVQLSGSSNAQSLIFQSAASYSYTFPASSGTLALASDLSSYVPTSRTLTINGETYDLSANRSWTITGITGSGTSGQVPYFDGPTSLTSEAGFIYDASTNRLGVNTSVPNATIGADAALNSGYGLLIKTGASNYNGIGIAIDSTYGNTIETAKLGTASARNLTLLNQTGFISLTEAGNLGVNILTPNFGIDIYNSTQSQLWLHNAASGLTATDGVRLALFNNLSANLRNFDGGLSLTAEGDFQIITIGAENLRVNSANGFVGIGNPASLPSMLTVNGGATITGLTTGQVLFPTSGGTLSGSSSLFWDNTNAKLGIGTTTLSGARVTITSTSDANHLQLVSNAPALTFTNALSITYYAGIGMATASNNFVTGAVQGDLVLGAFNTSSILFCNNNTNTLRMSLNGSGAAIFSGSVTGRGPKSQIIADGNSVGAGILLSNSIVGVNRRNWGIFTEQDVEGDFVIKRSTVSGSEPQSGTTVLSLSRDGDATFSSTVTARNYIINEASANRGGLYPYNRVLGSGTDYSVGLFSEGEIFLASGGSTTKRMVITSGGNVLIGTNTFYNGGFSGSASGLNINSAVPISLLRESSSGNTFYMGLSSNAFVGTQNAISMIFLTSDTTRMTITSGGKVEISIPTLANALKLNGANNYFTQFIKGGSGTGTSYGLTIAGGTNSSDTCFECTPYNESVSYFRVRGDGVSSFSTSIANLFMLSVTNSDSTGEGIISNLNSSSSGKTFFAGYSTSDSAYKFLARSNGGLANFQAYDVNLSDERTKKDIIPLESYWDKFKAIEIVKYKYKNQTHDDFNIGVIAQQVELVAPEFVDIDGFGETPEDGIPYKTIYTSDLHHTTIKVLQECMAKIEEQQAQIEELKAKIK